MRVYVLIECDEEYESIVNIYKDLDKAEQAKKDIEKSQIHLDEPRVYYIDEVNLID